MHPSSLATENLCGYMTYAVEMSSWTTKRIGNLLLTINGRQDSLFNYVFCNNGSADESAKAALAAWEYLQDAKTDATWVVDAQMKLWKNLVDKMGLNSPTVMKKVYAPIKKVRTLSKRRPDLVLERVTDDLSLTVLDELAVKIFYCNTNDLIILLRGVVKREQSRLRFFIAKLSDTVVGICGMYVQGDVVGLYSDGVLPEYRSMGIASEMVLRRLEIASSLFRCRYAVAQCVTQSVSLYEKLGFRVTGNLFLYPSLAAQ